MPDIQMIEQETRADLLARWQGMFKSEPPKSIGQALLRRILAFELQARQLGGLGRTTGNAIRAHQALGKPPRARSASFKAGSRFMREWNGVTHIVDVVENGYQWQGRTYRSLSAIARAITGAHWSGPRFFRQKQQGGRQ